MKVYFEHYRVHNNVDCTRGKPEAGCLQRWYRSRKAREARRIWVPRATGGATVCTIVLDNGQEVSGTAFCSMSDIFCYKVGRNLSYARAISRALAILDKGVANPKNKINIIFDKEDSVYIAAALKSALQSSALTDEAKAKIKEAYGRAVVAQPRD